MCPRNKEQKITLNISYHLEFKNIGKILNEIHLLLAPNEEYCNIVRFLVDFKKKKKSLKQHLVIANLPTIVEGGVSRRMPSL